MGFQLIQKNPASGGGGVPDAHAASHAIGGTDPITGTPISEMTDTWDDPLSEFDGIKLDATDASSAVGSRLLDLLISGVSKFRVFKSGVLRCGGLQPGNGEAEWIATGTTLMRGAFNGVARYEMNYFRQVLAADMGYGISSTAAPQDSPDIGWGRAAAGVAEFNNGTAGELRDVKVRNAIQVPPSSVTPQNNGELVFEVTSNTLITVKLKGSDGTVRTGTIALS